MSEESGTAMISYTDNVFAKHFMKMNTELMEKEVMKDLRELFSERDIPDPTFFKAHPWTDGVSYWLPGNYKPAHVSVEALKPGPGIYVCGESFSLRQGWMEGALEHAAILLRTHFR
jgi:monoamine oxidase